MNRAQQTVFRVRSDQTALSTAVAALVPSEIGRARTSVAMSQARRRSNAIRTTFCPVCGGDKLKESRRCAECRNAVQRLGSAEARANGRRSIGRRSAARALAGEAAIQANPARPAQFYPGGATKVHGVGVDHRQPWRRMVLWEGKWIAESDTPEGQERKASDEDAVARLTSWRSPT